MSEKDFSTEGLTAEQSKIANIIIGIAEKGYPEASGGGCKAFYTPKEWKARGEDYGTESKLVIVHDGGDLAPYFNSDYMRYEMGEEMQKALLAKGYYFEQCTCWYSAVYKK
jgi:hypothetical protein